VLTKYLGPNARAAIVLENKKGQQGETKTDMSKYDMLAVASYSKKRISIKPTQDMMASEGCWVWITCSSTILCPSQHV